MVWDSKHQRAHHIPCSCHCTQYDVDRCLQVQNDDEAWLYGVLNLDGSCDAAGYIVSGALPTNFMSTAAHGHSARPEQLPSSCAAQRAPSQGSKEVPHPKPPRVCLRAVPD